MGNRDEVLLATSAEWPQLRDEEKPLLDALTARGIRARPAVWTDPHVDWAAARLVVVRYVFDYVNDREGFCAWADRVEAVTPLHNPARVLRWNSHKSYLRDLESDGVPIVPTVWVKAGARVDLAGLMNERGWRDVVVKPAVDNGARRAVRVARDDAAAGQKHLEDVVRDREAMVQPYVPATEEIGEHALVHFDGRFSHAIRKDQMLAGRPFSLDRTPLIEPDPAELALAKLILDRFDPPLLYARVDTIVTDDGARLMELEVLEPVLFFPKAPGSADRMADAIAARL